jgi:serine/threonine protein kinase/Tol biopolymer transport system component
MPLAPDSQLGPYRIQSLIGEGGMGEVYLAKDTRLGRTVALKLLPSHLTHNEQMVQRMEREAQAISKLSHPHICTLYDIGNDEGKIFLVMEYLEGETLASILAKRRLELAEVLRYGIQIADALDKAHRTGIIHRDLKPANIMITKTGVKLLDFGLAKALITASSEVLTMSRTPTEANLTAEGSILGTLQYMAPEQLEGQDADIRTDIFALGTVLYEMCTQKKAFPGNSQAGIIAAILKSDVPPVSTLRPDAPPQLEHVVARCLAKDPNDRWQAVSDIKHELDWIAGSPSSALTKAVPARSRLQPVAIGLAIIALLGMGAFLLSRGAFSQRSQPAEPYALSVVMPEEAKLFVDYSQLAISPDGRRLVFVAQDASGKIFLWLRDLRSLDVRKMEGTEGATLPFWSPDNQWIAFFAQAKLKKIRITESQPEILCPVGNESGGGTWSREGIILFAPLFESPLYTISENGGPLKQATTFDASREDTNHLWPQFLPDQHHFLFHAMGRKGNGIYIGALNSSEAKAVMVTSTRPTPVAKFASPHYLVFAQDTALMVQDFDPDRLELSGQPVRIAQGLARLPWGEAFFSVGDQEILAFRTNVSRTRTQLAWFDRKGTELQRIGQPQSYESLSLAADNRHVLVGRWESSAQRSIWKVDLLTGIETKLTFNADDSGAIWSPDSSQLAFGSARETPPNLYVKTLARGESEERLFVSDLVNLPTSWSADGRYIIYVVRDPKKSFDLWALDLKEKRKQTPVAQTEFDELDGQISPDGNWIANQSNETGRFEIYIVPFLHAGVKTLVSSEGGVYPIWKNDGRELFYLDLNDRMMSVQVQPGSSLDVGSPQALFQAPRTSGWSSAYAVSSDGERFLLNTVAPQQPPVPPIDVLIHWSQLLH